MDKSDLERAQDEARKRLDPDNAMTPKLPQAVGSTISEGVQRLLRTPSRTREQTAAEAEDASRRQRIRSWQLLASKIGDRYAACVLSRWKYHGTATERDRQRVVVDRIALYCQQIPERVQGGSGVFLFGPPGTGKDFLVSALMREAVLNYGVKVEWANGVDLFSALRDAIGSDTTERKLVSQWITPQVLVLSDPLPPRGVLTDFQAAMLFRIIDTRYRASKPTWVTLNVQDKKEAEDRIGPQVVSRLLDSAVTCRCEWVDYRTVVHT